MRVQFTDVLILPAVKTRVKAEKSCIPRRVLQLPGEKLHHVRMKVITVQCYGESLLGILNSENFRNF